MYCDREEEWENSCPKLLKEAQKEIESFWKMVMNLEEERRRKEDEVRGEFYFNLLKKNSIWIFLLGCFYEKWLKKKYLYPKLEEIDKEYNEKRRKLDWERIRKLELWRASMFHKRLKNKRKCGIIKELRFVLFFCYLWQTNLKT